MASPGQVCIRRNAPQMRRAVASFFATWDKSNKTARYVLLKDFIAVNGEKTAAELDRELNMSGCLFLTRIVSWLQMLRGTKEQLHLLLQALDIFLAAPGGSDSFVDEVVMMGGIQCILDIVRSPKSYENDRYHGLKCIKSAMSAGLTYQVQLCKMRAVVCIGECLAVSKDAKTQSLAKEILESLPVRNEAYLGQVHSAFVQILSAQSFQARYYATISLNSIQKQMDKPPDAGIIKPLVNLLECSSVHVQQEVFDLMKLLLSYEKIKKSLLQELLKAMHITGSETDTDAADSNGGGSETNITPMEAALPDNIKQAACAHFIHQILSENSGSSDASVVKILEQGHVAEYLLYAFGNESFANSRKQAARSLRQLLHMRIENVRHVLLETLGEEFVQEIESCNDMDHVSLSVSPLQAMTMRSALLRLEYTGKLL